jgi:hydrogenase small subunit
MSRRGFLKLGATMAGVLAMPLSYAPRITAALEAAPRIPLIWLHGQSCSGNSAAFSQSSNPTAVDLLLSSLSIEYDELAMSRFGSDATAALNDALSRLQNGYIAVIDGAIPTAEEGVYCTVGGRSFRDVVTDVCSAARGTLAVGSCAFDGGTAAAAGGATGAVGLGQVVGGRNLVNLPGCPVNGDNLAAAIVHYLTFGEWPPRDIRERPYFAYGGLIHNQCERRPHFEFGEFVTAWGDEAAQKGWCLYKMGCKGPQTFANCATVKYAEGASWSVLAGHGCIGCTMPAFWNTMGGAYERLPAPVAYLPNVTADQIGVALVGGVAGLAAVHGAASVGRQSLRRRSERRAQARAARKPPTTAVSTPGEIEASHEVFEVPVDETVEVAPVEQAEAVEKASVEQAEAVAEASEEPEPMDADDIEPLTDSAATPEPAEPTAEPDAHLDPDETPSAEEEQ